MLPPLSNYWGPGPPCRSSSYAYVIDAVCSFDSREQNADVWDEMLPKLLNISYKDNAPNEHIRGKTESASKEFDELLTMVKK